MPALAESYALTSKIDVAAFCAGAAMAALPSPSQTEPSPPPFTVSFVRFWLDKAAEEGVKHGRNFAQTLILVSAQQTTIIEAFKARSAPFYDLTACDDAQPSVLWPIVPANRGIVSLDRLADDREVQIYRSMSGRLRRALAEVSAARAFSLDVRILALRHALAAKEAPARAALWIELSNAFRDRQIGIDAANQEQSIDSLLSALDLLDPVSSELGKTQYNLCFAYFMRLAGDRADNLERAISACEAALPVLDRAGQHDAWANTQLVLAGLWHDRMRGDRTDNIKRAIAADRAALEILTRGHDPSRWAAANVNLATHLAANRSGARQENVEAAIAAYEAAGEVITRDYAPQAFRVLELDSAPLFAERDKGNRASNQERAIAMLNDVLATNDLGSVVSSANYSLGNVYRYRLNGEHPANLATAVRYYRRALLGDSVGERWSITVGLALGSVLVGLGRYDEAADALLVASRAAERLIGLGLNEAQTRDVLTIARNVYTLLAYANVKMGRPASALSMLSAGKARLLSASLAADDLDLAPTEMSELRRLRGEIHHQENVLEAQARRDTPNAPPEIPPLNALEALRRQATALYEKGTRSIVTQPDIATSIQVGALVIPIVTEYGTEIVIVTAGGKIATYDSPGVTRAGVDEILINSDGRGGWLAQRGLPGQFGASLAVFEPAFRRSLGGAMRQALKSAGVQLGQPVVILPDGASSLAPLGLVRDGQTRRTLIEDYEISFTPSLSALAASRRRAALGRSSSLGLVRPPASAMLRFAPLEGSLAVTHFATTATKAWDGAERLPLLKALGSLSYWHFATHGVFNWSEPSQSGVLIGESSELLRLSDLMEARRQLGNPRLVVLSACDTGLSEIERNPDEFTGLPTGFIFAGAAGVVATLWPVNDLSTALLIGKFYDLHAGQGQAPARALRAAQLWIRDATLPELQAYVQSKGAEGILTPSQVHDAYGAIAIAAQDAAGQNPFAAPRFWGAFVLYGS